MKKSVKCLRGNGAMRYKEQKRLILLGWFSAKFVEYTLIPEIEENCIKYGIKYPTAYEIFKENMFAVNGF
ncbi:MAG: hypothetical protein NC307_10510 [Roseburia sp.]|nr:hypothetical protein [Roseburia sp.]